MSKSGNTERTTRAVPDDPTIASSSERLNELAMSFKKSQALSAALECDLFSAIAAGAGTPEEERQRGGGEAREKRRKRGGDEEGKRRGDEVLPPAKSFAAGEGVLPPAT